MVESAAPEAPDAPEDPVALTDLEVVTRYSLALRTASAERAELVRVLRDDLEWLTATAPARGTAPEPTAPGAATSTPRTPAPARPARAPRRRPAAGRPLTP